MERSETIPLAGNFKIGPELGSLLKRPAKGNEVGTSNAAREAGSNPGHSDTRTVDPVEITQNRPGRKPWTEEQRAAARAARAARKAEKEGVALEPEPREIPATVIGQWTALLEGIHGMLAVGLQAPELKLSKPEAEALATASAKVASYYSPMALSGKSGAWLSLVTTAGMIYVPRVMVMARRKNVSRETPSEVAA